MYTGILSQKLSHNIHREATTLKPLTGKVNYSDHDLSRRGIYSIRQQVNSQVDVLEAGKMGKLKDCDG